MKESQMFTQVTKEEKNSAYTQPIKMKLLENAVYVALSAYHSLSWA